MLIDEMTIEECRDALAQASLARLACEMDGQPYVVPVYLAYDGSDLIGFCYYGLQDRLYARQSPGLCGD